MMNNLEYQYKLGQGELPANQLAYDFTYGALTYSYSTGWSIRVFTFTSSIWSDEAVGKNRAFL